MGEKKFPPVKAEHVMILFERPEQKFEQIGIVSSLGGYYTSDGDMFKRMQSDAAKLGADAIIVREGGATSIRGAGGVTVVQTQTIRSAWEYPKTNAIAIKYLR